MFRKRPQFGGQNRQNLRFLEFLKKRKMTNFKSKNLCDKSLKIKNLRWQFSCIFRWLRPAILRFFCRRCYHGDICRPKLSLLKISKTGDFDLQISLWKQCLQKKRSIPRWRQHKIQEICHLRFLIFKLSSQRFFDLKYTIFFSSKIPKNANFDKFRCQIWGTSSTP